MVLAEPVWSVVPATLTEFSECPWVPGATLVGAPPGLAAGPSAGAGRRGRAGFLVVSLVRIIGPPSGRRLSVIVAARRGRGAGRRIPGLAPVTTDHGQRTTD